MAGSIKNFVYTTDKGDDFAIRLDESNTEELNGAVQDQPNTPAATYAVPRNIKPRSLYYTSADGLVTRRVVALTTAIYNGADTAKPSFNDPVSGKDVFLRRKVGEQITFPLGVDTGLIDGDAT